MLLMTLVPVGATEAGAATKGPALSVNVSSGRRPISPHIYGMNFAPRALAKELRLPVDRWGGNSTETYNFEIGVHNTGQDYFYENIPDCWDVAHNYCNPVPDASDPKGYDEFIAKDQDIGAETILTLPLMGWVSKPPPVYDHPFPCSFKVSKYGPQTDVDPFDPDCGNGISADSGQPITNNDPTDAGVAIDVATNAGNWVGELVSTYGPASSGGVRFYELGNEPGLWHETHRAFHPDGVSYDELWTKSRDAAIAVKAADPSAEVIGFSEWAWPNYFCSAADGAPDVACNASRPDRAAHGGTPLVEWLLQNFADEEQASGTRLLDYIDVHYYPQGNYQPFLDITRPLYDANYTDPSWIGEDINLLTRMNQWVGDNYPGTKLALTEYNFEGFKSNRLNVLAQADALGLFARGGVDLATWWDLAPENGRLFDAWRIFRNYDGNGSGFGTTYVESGSSNERRLAVYAAQRDSGTLTILVINKSAKALTSKLGLSGISPKSMAQVWRWMGSGISKAASQRVRSSGFTATYPARSLTLFVIAEAG
jgi:Glycoside hydrolase family 44